MNCMTDSTQELDNGVVLRKGRKSGEVDLVTFELISYSEYLRL